MCNELLVSLRRGSVACLAVASWRTGNAVHFLFFYRNDQQRDDDGAGRTAVDAERHAGRRQLFGGCHRLLPVGRPYPGNRHKLRRVAGRACHHRHGEQPDLFVFPAGRTDLGGEHGVLPNIDPDGRLHVQAFNAILTLGGPANAFINGTDFQTLRPGPVDPGASSLFLNGRSSISGAVRLTSVSLNDLPVPVPEPAGWAVLAVGLLAAVAGVRFGRLANRPVAVKG